MDTEKIPFARPFIGEAEEAAVLRVLRSGWLTTGSETLAFEKEFAAFFGEQASAESESGRLHALAVNSATSGLHLAMEAAGVGPGDVVLVPSFTFTATAEVVRYLSADVAFVDVTPGTCLMDPQKLEETLLRLKQGLPAYERRGEDGSIQRFGPKGNPKAAIPVHYGGLPCDMDAIMEIARKFELFVCEDAAHAFPSRLEDGRWAGLLGDVGVFSFYATKTITTGEGGMAVTRNSSLSQRMAIMRSHGIDRSVWNRYTDTKASWYYEVVAAGYKYNLPDILGALGRAQLSRAMDLLEMRRAIARIYDDNFKDCACLSLPATGAADARHLYPLKLGLENLSISRDRFIDLLQERGIGVSVHFIPLHTMPYYREKYSLVPGDFPESCKAFTRSISLPIWPGMDNNQIMRVTAAVLGIAREYST
ncbi:DegT/DnrJ/EryC1/StrS family aminotransferase [Breznakiella homolactica]|uniref:DegT/DnrJ/EryC1/StrS family aminotransferase n=1 Tax=Breznakiella homolactica TaxID=2798577 RepID=A0A7T7XKV2_9SPIR|nr:DegT/DnrJ/EryC1/StrS family aminotransferase [Breznakiella homolactica]QQO08053.1 DegT/DnrJ/EryC1/StrS family aminotransferase [Breznakiella homolactica]